MSEKRISKILYHVSSAGCLFWRCRQPMKWMSDRGLLEVRAYESEYSSAEQIGIDMAWCDAVVVQSPCSVATLVHLMKCKELGKKVFIDFDDFPFECSPFNAHYKELGTEDASVIDPTTGQKLDLWKAGEHGFDPRANTIQQMALINILADQCVDGIVIPHTADLLTVTTEYLRDKFVALGANPNTTFVVPNALDLSKWRPNPEARKHYKDDYRIGWVCSASHMEDWFSIYMALKKFLDCNPGSKLVVMGDVGIDIAVKFPPHQLEWVGWSDLLSGHYTYQVASLGLDVAICPLADNTFNRCKSPLKYSEMTAFGFPVIAQDMPPYSPVIVDGVNGMLAKDHDEWIQKLTLMKNPALRAKILKGATETLHEFYDLDKVCYRWAQIYNDGVNSEEFVLAEAK